MHWECIFFKCFQSIFGKKTENHPIDLLITIYECIKRNGQKLRKIKYASLQLTTWTEEVLLFEMFTSISYLVLYPICCHFRWTWIASQISKKDIKKRCRSSCRSNLIDVPGFSPKLPDKTFWMQNWATAKQELTNSQASIVTWRWRWWRKVVPRAAAEKSGS